MPFEGTEVIPLERGQEIVFGRRKCLVIFVSLGRGIISLSPLGCGRSFEMPWSILKDRYTLRENHAVAV